nr:hypothetical protein [uncultured Acetatifactor sp.]
MCSAGKGKRILAVSKASPFDYRNHALLYLPEDMPFPDVRIAAYRNAVTDRLEELIRLSHGHTLVLFTSCRTMETVHQELAGRIEDVGIFILGSPYRWLGLAHTGHAFLTVPLIGLVSVPPQN